MYIYIYIYIYVLAFTPTKLKNAVFIHCLNLQGLPVSGSVNLNINLFSIYILWVEG